MTRCFFLLWLCIIPLAAQANNAMLHPTGLPIPRFVSLKSNEVNVRVGPGTRYPISWVFKRRYYPVEIIEEFGHWRKIRDHENSEGWVHKSLISGKRTAMIRADSSTLYTHADAQSPASATLQQGAIAVIEECGLQWCHLSFIERKGWAKKGVLWGVYRDEEIRD